LLYALPDPGGWYPALVPAPDGPPVRGLLFPASADFSAEDLARIDAYEDYRPGDAVGSEYLRRDIAVRCAATDRPVTAQAYAYNRPLPPDAEAIPEGDFLDWLARHKRRGFLP